MFATGESPFVVLRNRPEGAVLSSPLFPSQRVSTLQTPLASNSPLKVLVVGDHGCGKSLLLRFLPCVVNGTPWSPPSTPLPSTLGFLIECVEWGSSTRGKDVFEFIEIGGNRSFSTTCRSPVYHSSCAGVIFMYNRDDPTSIEGLRLWKAELEEHRILYGSKGFLLIGVSHQPFNITADGCGDAEMGFLSKAFLLSVVFDPVCALRGVVRGLLAVAQRESTASDSWQRMVCGCCAVVAFFLQWVIRIEQYVFFFLSCVLFGVRQPSAAVTSFAAENLSADRNRLINSLREDPKCVGEVFWSIDGRSLASVDVEGLHHDIITFLRRISDV